MPRYQTVAVWIAAFALALVAIRYGGVLQRSRSPIHQQVAVVPTIGRDVLVGPDAVAAAFRGGLRCQRLTFAPRDPEYFRAQPDRSRNCSGYGPDSATIYREVGREFRVVLDTADYECPARGVPSIVQRELRLCPRDG